MQRFYRHDAEEMVVRISESVANNRKCKSIITNHLVSFGLRIVIVHLMG